MATLKRDIYSAFEKILTAFSGNPQLTGEQQEFMEGLAEDLAISIKDWLVKQTFRITDMKAILEVESLETTGPRFADVLPSVQTTVPPGINAAGVSNGYWIGSVIAQTTTPMIAPVTAGVKGVMLPKLTLKKQGAQGGILISKGHAYIGANPVDSAETNVKTTQVKLLKADVKDLR